jgi:hypothetical protein
MRLSRRFEPFDSDDYIFELKIDAFPLAYVESRLMSSRLTHRESGLGTVQ